MSQILIRGLETGTVRRLKGRAKQHGRSLESEARHILEHAVGFTAEELESTIDRWRKTFGGRRFSDSAILVRKDRQR